MKRIEALNLLMYAGYHGDMAAFTRLYCENRIAINKAKMAYDDGIRLKKMGMKCNCSECQKEMVKS